MGNSSPSAPARKHSVIVMVTECFLVIWVVLAGEKFGVVQSTHSGTLIGRFLGYWIILSYQSSVIALSFLWFSIMRIMRTPAEIISAGVVCQELIIWIINSLVQEPAELLKYTHNEIPGLSIAISDSICTIKETVSRPMLVVSDFIEIVLERFIVI